MSLCKYKNIFGESGTGIHSFKLFGVAVVDLFLTILVAQVTKKYNSYSFTQNLIGWLILGYALHRLFCVDDVTTIYSQS